MTNESNSGERVLEKVTAFITRHHAGREELLLFHHPNAGIQIPAGTVEMGEDPATAVLREAREESALSRFSAPRLLADLAEPASPQQAFIFEAAQVSALPDEVSLNWACLPRGIQVQIEREDGDFVQVTYEEHDQYLEPNYVSYQITGWVPRRKLTRARRRYLFEMECLEPTPETWTSSHDGPRFRLFWADLRALPAVVPPQAAWLVKYLRRRGEQSGGRDRK